MKLRGKTISYSSFLKKDKDKQLKILVEKISVLEDSIRDDFQNINETILSDLSTNKRKLEQIHEEEARGIQIRNRIKWYEEGEKPTSYFCHLENRNYTSKLINSIVNNKGEVITDGQNILDEIKNFYEKLYIEPNTGLPVNNISLNSINTPKLNKEDTDKLEKEISIEEINKAVLAMKHNKSPGIDGYPIEFFKFFWKDLGPWIHRFVNETFKNNKLSTTMNRGVITCLPKPNKDRKLIKNFTFKLSL